MTSGIDLALAFLSSVANREVAGKVQLMLEYFPSQVSSSKGQKRLILGYFRRIMQIEAWWNSCLLITGKGELRTFLNISAKDASNNQALH